MTGDLFAISHQEASRLTLPGQFVKNAGWPGDCKDFQCYGFFRSDGELLCCPATTKTASGDHPFAALIQKFALTALSITPSIHDLPPAATLAAPFRFREFSASWSGTNQINLKLGSVYLGLLGWVDSVRPPIYPVATAQIICLFSQRKIEEIQKIGNRDIC
jgi:hypothetical protein